MITKSCTKCGVEKPLEEFYRGSKSADGYKSRCKVCTEELRRLNRPIKVKIIPDHRICPNCKVSKNLEEDFHKCKSRPNGFNVYCKICTLAKGRRYKASEGGKQRKLEWYYSEESIAKRKEWFKVYSKSDKRKEQALKYSIKHPDRLRASCARRRSSKLQATPNWFEIEKIYITFIYKVAKELSEQMGIVYNVDHIVPLKSEFVCGLHTISNLQILPESVNKSKGNKYWPDMP